MVAPPISRQPSCRYCEPHEEHLLRCLAELEEGAMCPCPPKKPNGIYDESPARNERMDALRNGGGPRDAPTSEGLTNT